MTQLTVGNSLCTLTRLTTAQHAELRKLLSYTQMTRRRGHFGSVRNYLVTKAGQFPTGLLYLVEEFIQAKGLSVSVTDTRVRPTPRPGAPTATFLNQPRPEQVEAAEAAVREARGIIVAPTGLGKSYILALVINKLQVPTLVVVPGVGLKTQLTEGLREIFGDAAVGPLVGGKRKYFITVENIDALDPKKAVAGFDAVILDEFHHAGAATYRQLNVKAWAGVYYKFGLTATPFRSKDEERLLLESVLSKVIYKIDYQTAVAKGYITPVEAYYVDLPPVKMTGSESNYHAVYSECIANNAYLNQVASQLMCRFIQEGRSTLTLVKHVAHGAAIQEECMLSGEIVPFAKGENDDNKELVESFNRLDPPGLIGTTVVGEGVDTRPCEMILVCGGGKSKNQFMQNVGRGFRRFEGKETCKVILFRYAHNKWLAEHFKQCVKYLKVEYGVVPIKLEV